MATIRQAVILAGGLGTRLRPLTNQLPKPMVPVAGKPFLEHLVGMLRQNGIEELVLLLGYLPEKITEHFGDGKNFGVSIKYSIGSVQDLTGTRVRNAAPLLAQEFLLLYSDNYWPMDLKKMLKHYREKQVLGALTAYSNRHGDAEHGRENNVRIDSAGLVTRYGPFSDDPQLNAVDIGFFLMNKDVVDLMPEENFSFEHVVLPKLIEQNNLAGYVTDHPYHSITTIGQLPTVEKFLSDKKVMLLDRDGVINKQMPPHDYVKKWREFEFLPGALEACKALTDAGYQIYLISNQRGIARGLMTPNDLDDIHAKMAEVIQTHGGRIAGVYSCPHSNDDRCSCRKPKPGMLFQAARDHAINLTKTVFIGDEESDRLAGDAAGCRMILVTPEQSLASIVNDLLNHPRL